MPLFASEDPCVGAPEFEASQMFDGCRPCMVFKNGPAGLGYYIDRTARVGDVNMCTKTLPPQVYLSVFECESSHGLPGIKHDANNSSLEVVCL